MKIAEAEEEVVKRKEIQSAKQVHLHVHVCAYHICAIMFRYNICFTSLVSFSARLVEINRESDCL